MVDAGTAPVLEEGWLPVSDGNELHFQLVGAPDGEPAVAVHGGPGSGTTPLYADLFDLERYQVLLFDQRGCGDSRPHAGDPSTDLAANTTDHLVADIEALRHRLDIDRWLVLGLSWGSTLGLAYAQRHPAAVSGVVLGLVVTGTRREVSWITRDMGRFVPEAWSRFRDGVPAADRDGDLADAYARLLEHPDAAVRGQATEAWCAWEDTHVAVLDGAPAPRMFSDDVAAFAFARLVTHYWRHACFLEDEELLDGMGRLADLPGVLVHGRADLSSPLDVPWELHRRWPGSELVIVEGAGHGGPSLREALRAATDRMASRPR